MDKEYPGKHMIIVDRFPVHRTYETKHCGRSSNVSDRMDFRNGVFL